MWQNLTVNGFWIRKEDFCNSHGPNRKRSHWIDQTTCSVETSSDFLCEQLLYWTADMKFRYLACSNAVYFTALLASRGQWVTYHYRGLTALG